MTNIQKIDKQIEELENQIYLIGKFNGISVKYEYAKYNKPIKIEIETLKNKKERLIKLNTLLYE